MSLESLKTFAGHSHEKQHFFKRSYLQLSSVAWQHFWCCVGTKGVFKVIRGHVSF